MDRCPTHGYLLPTSGRCPLCEAVDQPRGSPRIEICQATRAGERCCEQPVRPGSQFCGAHQYIPQRSGWMSYRCQQCGRDCAYRTGLPSRDICRACEDQDAD